MSIPSNALLDMQAVSQRAASWQFDLLDQGRQVIGENLEIDREQVPTLTVDTSRSIKRTLTGIRLNPGLLDEIDIIKNRIRVTMVLGDESRWNQGIFMFSQVSQAIISSFGPGDRLTIPALNCVDQLQIVDQAVDYSIAYGPGKVITDAITELLSELPIEFDVTPSGTVVAVGMEAIAWPAGTSRLRIVNELATMIGYHDLFFDNNGTGQCHPMPDPEAQDDNQVINYPIGSRAYLGTALQSTNLLELPNRFIVINTGANQTTVVGIYDVPASAPHSFENRGYRRTHVEQIQGVDTAADARVAARALARSWRFPFETFEFSGPPDPRHDHYSVFEWEGTRYLELNHSMPCQDGANHRHVGRRTYEAGAGEVFDDAPV